MRKHRREKKIFKAPAYYPQRKGGFEEQQKYQGFQPAAIHGRTTAL
jgi:hypothetical protein